jgi:hypothetical protein
VLAIEITKQDLEFPFPDRGVSRHTSKLSIISMLASKVSLYYANTNINMWHRSEQGSCTCLISVVVAENVLKQTHFNGDNIENYPTCFAWHYSGFSFDDNFNVMQTIPYS